MRIDIFGAIYIVTICENSNAHMSGAIILARTRLQPSPLVSSASGISLPQCAEQLSPNSETALELVKDAHGLFIAGNRGVTPTVDTADNQSNH